jgi:hypothetical protein
VTRVPLIPVFLAAIALLAPEASLAQPGGAGGRIVRGKLGPRVRRNPAQVKKQINRINGLPAHERRRLIERLPPERRSEAERRLQRFNELSPEEQDQVLREYDQFQSESPERQRAVRRLWQQFSEFSAERKPQLRREVQALRAMAPEEREERLASPEFRERFSPKERKFLGDLSKTFDPEDEEEAEEPDPQQP